MKTRSWVAGIDMGYRNLGVCVIDPARPNKPIVMQRLDILGELQPDRHNLWAAMMTWCDRNAPLLANCKTIVLETQRRAKFANMNTVVMTRFPTQWRLLHPFTLCAAYQLPRTREQKKKATISHVKARFDANVMDEYEDKMDDVADAALMAFWAIEKMK